MSSFQALKAQRQVRQAPLQRLGGGVGHPASAAAEPAAPTSQVPPRLSPSVSTEPNLAHVASPASPAGSASSPSTKPTPISPNEPNLRRAPDATATPASSSHPALANTPLTVKHTPTHGRGVYTTTPVQAGTVLLRTTPRVSVLSKPDLRAARTPSGLELPCTNCYKVSRAQRCAACKSAYYCSGACQKADWAGHKNECAALKRLRGMWAAAYPDRAGDGDENGWVPSEAVRALGRLCWARRGGEGNWGEVAAMESHASRKDQDGKMALAKEVMHLRYYLGAANKRTGEGGAGGEDVVHPVDMEDFGFTSASELLDLVSAFMVNSFTLSSADLTPLGVAMSPVCALFNHSCEPNAVVVFPRGGREMVVVAIGDIAEGQEVLTSYVDVSQPTAERQREVQERYDFRCDCGLCASTEVDPRWCVIHPGCVAGGRGRMPDLRHEGDASVRCTCGEVFTIAVQPLRRAIEDGKRILVDDERGQLALHQLVNLLPRLVSLLPPSAHPLLQLLRLNAQLLMPPTSIANRASAISLLTAAAIGAAQVHPKNHPTVGIILAERAKLLAMDPEMIGQEGEGGEGKGVEGGRRMLSEAQRPGKVASLMSAVEALRDAVKACDGGFGGGGAVAGALRRLLEDCEGELDLLRSM